LNVPPLRPEVLADFRTLSQALFEMIEAQHGQPLPGSAAWINDQQWIASKFSLHLISVRDFMVGSTLTIAGTEHHVFDHASIAALVRTLVENLIVFAYHFGTQDDEVKRFRNRAWRLGGLTDRLKMDAVSQAATETQATEAIRAEEYRLELRSHPIFQSLTKQQKKFLEKGDWRMGKGWHELAGEAGLSIVFFRNLYGYLSGYSHTSYASALQVGQATQYEQRRISQAIVSFANVCVVHFARLYAESVPHASPFLEPESIARAFQRWYVPAQQLDNYYGKSLT
jgi:hypothetical protein